MGFSMTNKDGYIYIISNPAMPGSFFSTKRYLKIGLTIDIRSRLRSLFNTSVPFPFVVEHLLYVPDRFAYELAIHEQLEKYRVPEDREYFYLSPKKAIRLIHGKRSKVFELAQSKSKVLIQENVNTPYLPETSEAGELGSADDRTQPKKTAKGQGPTGKLNKKHFEEMLAKIKRDIDNDALEDGSNFTMLTIRHKYGIGDTLIRALRTELRKQKYLKKSGRYHVVTKPAKAKLALVKSQTT